MKPQAQCERHFKTGQPRHSPFCNPSRNSARVLFMCSQRTHRCNKMIKGSCLCGGIRFEIDAVRSLTHCHCGSCRKLTGAAFASYVHVEADKFRLVSGEDLAQRFESSPGSFRTFCRVCGSIAPGRAPYLTTVSIPAGLLDDDPGVRPKLHVFVDSKAPWWEIADGLPQHGKWVPGFAPKTQ
jgi:hypothetical protein